MDIRIFRNVSVNGRIAYSICCLEKTLMFYNCPIDKWKCVLEKLWTFSTAPCFYEWFEEITEWLPDNVLESPYSIGDCEYISEEQFDRLYDLYKDTNEIIVRIFRLLYELATADAYSKIRNEGERTTLTYLEEIVDLMNINNIALPSYNNFVNYEFDMNVNCGYGKAIGKEYSLILNN